jgi:hypothetical protein
MTRPETATGIMTGRQRLPNRRGHELLDFEHAGIRCTAGFAKFDDGGLAEVFLNTTNYGTSVDVNAHDAAVAASLLLRQSDVLRHKMTVEINEKRTPTDDQFWDAMERKPNYSAFLDRFNGFKNYRGISAEIWARWDQANLKFQSEEAFWAQMERDPDLQALIGRYGGYPRISAEKWARWDAANTKYQFRLRGAQLGAASKRSEKPERGLGSDQGDFLTFPTFPPLAAEKISPARSCWRPASPPCGAWYVAIRPPDDEIELAIAGTLT